MDNYNALRRIASIADEVFSLGGSPIDALEKIRLIAVESVQAAQQKRAADLACTCALMSGGLPAYSLEDCPVHGRPNR